MDRATGGYADHHGDVSAGGWHQGVQRDLQFGVFCGANFGADSGHESVVGDTATRAIATVSQSGASPLRLADALQTETASVRIDPTSPAAGKQLVDLHLPEHVLIVLVERGHEHFVPSGSTIVATGDVLTLVASREVLERTRQTIFRC